MASRLCTFILISTTVCTSLSPVLGCGDKFLVVSRGTRFQRAPVTRSPAAILIYTNPTSEARKALAGVAVDATLRQAGYRPTMVDSAAAFESALGRGGWDLVLVGLADAEAVSKRSKNVGVLPVVVNPTSAELQQTRKLYPVVLKVPAKGPAVLEAVDDALTARSKQKSSRTAS